MSDGKFEADPVLLTGAMKRMKDAVGDVNGIFDRFQNASAYYQQVLKSGEFGRTLAEQIRSAREGFAQAGLMFVQGFEAVPERLGQQRTYLQKIPLGMLESIHQAQAQQSEITPKSHGGRK